MEQICQVIHLEILDVTGKLFKKWDSTETFTSGCSSDTVQALEYVC